MTIFSHFELLIRTCLDLADEACDREVQTKWTMVAWGWVHRAKSRVFMELLDGIEQEQTQQFESHVSKPHEVMKSLRQLWASSGECPLLIEYFTFGVDEIVVFIVPLWKEKGIISCRFPVAEGFVEELCVQVLQLSQRPDDNSSRIDNLSFDLEPFLLPVCSDIEELQPTSIIISPHFYLNLLPLHAANLNGEPLIAKYPVTYLPTPAIAERLQLNSTRMIEGAAIIGDPKGDLAFARAEAEGIARILNELNVNNQILLGQSATSHAVCNLLDKAGILHLTCHAVLEKEFHQSGIELSDRRVTVEEIMQEWDLSKTMLAFLGTCVSGLTITGPSDDYMALARVFFYSGVSTVIANLWSAKEAPGECFATNFYRAWISEKQPLPIAFQQATLVTRELFPAPHHWASFVLVGVPDLPQPEQRD